MKKLLTFVAGLSLLLSGCVARTYTLTKDRVDQDLTPGNRGYLAGNAPSAPERKSTREVNVVEIELGFPRKLKGTPVSTQTGSAAIESSEPMETESVGVLETYKVGKNDTLQKISKKYYGTTKKWYKIYEFNKETLKTPDRLYPGQEIKIPDLKGTPEPIQENRGNLK
jgi:nucleoid-associated protein YgaU